MSYLLQHAARRPNSARRTGRGVRVDERMLLNLPEFCGGADVCAFVEDTSHLRGGLPEPSLHLRISDCSSEIWLEFGVESAARRQNSLHKIDTLLAVLHRFRDGLADEAALYAERECARANR